MKQKILTIMFASVMAMLAFTACSNDDEPQEPSGEKMLENIDKIIVDQAEAGNLYLKRMMLLGLYWLQTQRRQPMNCVRSSFSTNGTESNALSSSLTTAAQSHLRRGQMKASFTLFRSMHSRISESRL